LKTASLIFAGCSALKTARPSALVASPKASAILVRQATAKRVALVVLVAGILILCTLAEPTLGNLFVTVPPSPDTQGTIGEYTNSGATVNASLLTGLSFPGSIAVSDGFIYVTNSIAGTIGKYTISGVAINPTLISGLNSPQDIEVSGGNLYVAEYRDGLNSRVGKYTTSGETVNPSLITGLQSATGLAISGTNLFVGNSDGTLGEYTTSGATVDASLITNLQFVSDVEVSGSNLFISHGFFDDTVIGKYKLDGTAINPLLIFNPSGGGEFAISGTDLFVVDDNKVNKFNTFGMVVAAPLIFDPTFHNFGAIAVDGPATVPETLSTLWFGLATVALLGFAQLLRARHRALVEASR
jgi:hypothetical protein